MKGFIARGLVHKFGQIELFQTMEKARSIEPLYHILRKAADSKDATEDEREFLKKAFRYIRSLFTDYDKVRAKMNQ